MCARAGVAGTALVRPAPALPDVHRQLGWFTPADARARGIDVRLIPQGGRARRIAWLRCTIRDVEPEAIWVQQEPTDALLLDALVAMPLLRRPRIVGAACENIFVLRLRARLTLPLLWRRLDALAAVATASIDGARRVGMPSSVLAEPLVAGALDPPRQLRRAALPFPDDAFVVLFVGRVTAEKGINVLLSTFEGLDSKFCLLVVGDGPLADELRRRAAAPPLRDRVLHVGLVPHGEVWSYYAAAHCLVAPSLTTARWKEQFGGVIADGLAAGVPIIGSSSGAIPEVVGDAGLIVPERSPSALAAAIRRLETDRDLRDSLSTAGRARFTTEFSLNAYADKLARLLGLASSAAAHEVV